MTNSKPSGQWKCRACQTIWQGDKLYQALAGLVERIGNMAKVFVEVEINVKDDVNFNIDAWEGSLNGYFESATFKVRQPTKDAQDGACGLCGGEVVDPVPAFCKQCRVQDPPRL